ncbi:MAG: transporter substrate-binding domain-containing protein [Alphaproteobacteria bacterium]|nr:transporter substrate-binding domain-containing protein [Alphaproteobacteria bacterium]
MNKTSVLALILAFIALTTVFMKQPSQNKTYHETRLEQVKRTGVIRCGYMVWPPFLKKDMRTGALDGLLYDLIEEIGRQLKLKIEWTTETTWGQMLTDLSMNRFDMACVPAFVNPARAREADFISPLFYAPINLYARKGDTRFDNNYEAANVAEVKFAAQDGQFTGVVANEMFPNATKVSIPQLTGGEDLYVMVGTNKADVIISDPYSYANFTTKNDDSLRLVLGSPLRVAAIGFPVPSNEPAFKNMLATTVIYLQDSGFFDKTIKKHEGTIKTLRAAKHYEE